MKIILSSKDCRTRKRKLSVGHFAKYLLYILLNISCEAIWKALAFFSCLKKERCTIFRSQPHYSEPVMSSSQRDYLNQAVYNDISMGWVPSLYEYSSRASVCESASAQSKKEVGACGKVFSCLLAFGKLCRSCVPEQVSSWKAGPAFAFSGCDMAGGLSFAFDVFCITLTYLASQSLLVLNCRHCQVLLHFFLSEDRLRIIRNVSKQSMYSILKEF